MVNTLMLAYAHRRELKSLLAMRTGTKSGG
jgi:hypothetical protein